MVVIDCQIGIQRQIVIIVAARNYGPYNIVGHASAMAMDINGSLPWRSAQSELSGKRRHRQKSYKRRLPHDCIEYGWNYGYGMILPVINRGLSEMLCRLYRYSQWTNFEVARNSIIRGRSGRG